MDFPAVNPLVLLSCRPSLGGFYLVVTNFAVPTAADAKAAAATAEVHPCRVR